MQPFAHHVVEDESDMIPFVRHTFIHVGPTPEALRAERNCARRCVSLSPRGNRDSFTLLFHSLLHKPTPVPQTQPVRCCGAEPLCQDEAVGTEAMWVSGREPTGPELKSSVARIRWSEEKEAETNVAPHLKLNLRNGRRGNSVKVVQGEKVRHQCDPNGEDDRSTEAGSAADIGELSCSSRESGDATIVQDDQDLDEEELLRRVPSDAHGNRMSVGSIAHEAGTCKPCVFAYNTKKPCGNGDRCSFCHFVHPPKVRVRLCKKKRMDIKRAQEAEQEDARCWR